MSLRVSVTRTTEIELGIEEGAEWFAGLSDDEMSKFFCAVAEKAKAWKGMPDDMWYFVGKHLAKCECSTEDARDMIRRWAYWLNHHEHTDTPK